MRIRRSKQLLFTIILSLVTIIISAQDNKLEKIKAVNLTYYWVGNACPEDKFVIMESRYGFKMQCVGCSATARELRNNRRVVRKINSVYGKNWFEGNKQSLR